MTAAGGSILQIVPQAPGAHEGVGDYALTLAARLRSDHQRETIFAVGRPTSIGEVAGFAVLSPLAAISEKRLRQGKFEDIILHYVNYGYQSRGIPFDLLRAVRRLRNLCGGRLITIFHELYASAPPWQSAFWLQPLQKSIARRIACMSDACVVSSEVMRDALRRLGGAPPISVHLVSSSLGEPVFSENQFAERDPHRWVIFGGTHLVERSLDSLLARIPAIPAAFAPDELFILGGEDNPAVREKLRSLAAKSEYLPAIEAKKASALLSSCAFGWIDYFRQPSVPLGVILKSGSFGALCAHGVIPVFPSDGTRIGIGGDAMPGPYFVDSHGSDLPADRTKAASEIYAWYRRRASSQHLADGIARLLGLANDGKPATYHNLSP